MRVAGHVALAAVVLATLPATLVIVTMGVGVLLFAQPPISPREE